MRTPTPGQARHTTTCVETTAGPFVQIGRHNVRLPPGLGTHICFTTIELNINLTCITMKLSMKTMVMPRRGSWDEREAAGGRFGVDFNVGAGKCQGALKTVTRVSPASQPAPGADSWECFSLQSPLWFLGLSFARLFRSYRSIWSLCVCVN